MNDNQVFEARVVQYEFEVEMNAPPTRVWKALTDQLSSWWLPDFHMLGADSIVSLEPVPGGRLFEQCGDKGLLWYTVLAIAPNESLSLAGYCTAEFGGPCSTLLSGKPTRAADEHAERVIHPHIGAAVPRELTPEEQATLDTL